MTRAPHSNPARIARAPRVALLVLLAGSPAALAQDSPPIGPPAPAPAAAPDSQDSSDPPADAPVGPPAPTPVIDPAPASPAPANPAPPGPAPPGDDGPLVVGENRNEYRWWDLQRFNIELEFFGEFRTDRQRTAGQPTITVHDDRLRGTVNAEFESYIGHKNLIDLFGNFRLGYEDQQIRSSEPGGDAHESPLIDFYDVQALILQEGPAPLTIYSRRDETVTAREFNSALRTQTTEHGAILSIRSDFAPTRLQYFHREQEQSDNLLIDNSSVQDSFLLQSNIRLAERQRLDISYALDAIDEDQGFGLTDNSVRHDGTVTHSLEFGQNAEHNLRSAIHVFEQSGRFEQSDVRLDENLFLRHSDTLDSRYDLTIENQTFGGQEQRLIAGSASVRHRLFDSLVSSATAGGSRVEFPDVFTSDDIYINGQLDYTKRVPYGRLHAGAGASFDHQSNSERGSNLFIVDEPRTFSDPLPIVLTRRNIIAGSIVITNATRTYTFQQGLDYTISAFPDRVEIRREPLGPNPPGNGETVLITYQIGPEPGNDIDSASFSFSFRYAIEEGPLSGLAVFLYYLNTDRSVSAVDPSIFVLDDVQELRYGAEYRIWDISLLAERRNHDSTISPYDQNRFEARYNRRFGRDTSIAIELTRDEIDFRDTGESLDLNRATGRWNQRLTQTLDFSAYLQYRDEQNSTRGNIQGFEQAIELHWNYGQTRFFAGFRNSILDGENSERTSQTITIGLTRSF